MERLTKLGEELRENGCLLPAWLEKNKVMMLDQTELPVKEVYVEVESYQQVVKAIKDMLIRGSGAIALAGIYGLMLAALESRGDYSFLAKAGEDLKKSRPTAVNLMKTVDYLLQDLLALSPDQILQEIESRAVANIYSQLEVEKQIGRAGASLVKDGSTILTVCHAGALAGFGFGGRTLSVFKTAREEGKQIEVIALETRPYLQGMRITAWELQKTGIPCKIITDNMAATVMSKGLADLIVTGSDRIAANGDTANKVGSLMLALVAKEYGVPYYVSTSRYNIDFSISTGQNIPVEMRDPEEMFAVYNQRIAPDGAQGLYYSFDITPEKLITAIITERGIVKPPLGINLKNILNEVVA